MSFAGWIEGVELWKRRGAEKVGLGTSKFVHMSFVRRGAGDEDGGKSLYFRSIGIDREVGPNVSSGEASSFKCHM